MSMLLDWQQRFIAAMRTSERADADLGQDNGLKVYRNNIRHSLVEALEIAFPHTRALLGERFFSALANDYVTIDPPRDPRLNRYGEGLINRLDYHPALENYRFVADICRLERARLDVSHADDAISFDALQLSQHEDLHELYVLPHPASRCVRCRHDVAEIWDVMEQGQKATALGPNGPGYWLVIRRQRKVSFHRINDNSASLYGILSMALPLGATLDMLSDPSDMGPEALGLALGELLGLGALAYAPDYQTSSLKDSGTLL
uniref:HvfC/BufC N-terminal domain-containing protein n=1 Tax=Halomonas sp. TaxID=1486246 RepID=UPI002607ED15|nr:DNA-binding domain-containing protein [Halomonas sp.]